MQQAHKFEEDCRTLVMALANRLVVAVSPADLDKLMKGGRALHDQLQKQNTSLSTLYGQLGELQQGQKQPRSNDPQPSSCNDKANEDSDSDNEEPYKVEEDDVSSNERSEYDDLYE